MTQRQLAKNAVDLATKRPFLIAAFRLEADGTLVLQRVTDNFPYDRIHEAIDLLVSDIKKEAPQVFEEE